MTNTKPWLWLLVASLALNVFLGVTLSTHFFRGPKGPPPRPEQMILDMADSLPEPDARILRQSLESHRSELAGEEDQPPKGDRIREVLSSDPFDLEAFRQVTSEFHASHERTGRVITEILAEALPRMSYEGRKHLADHPPRPR